METRVPIGLKKSLTSISSFHTKETLFNWNLPPHLMKDLIMNLGVLETSSCLLGNAIHSVRLAQVQVRVIAQVVMMISSSITVYARKEVFEYIFFFIFFRQLVYYFKVLLQPRRLRRAERLEINRFHRTRKGSLHKMRYYLTTWWLRQVWSCNRMISYIYI